MANQDFPPSKIGRPDQRGGAGTRCKPNKPSSSYGQTKPLQ
ncbi:hypothetical protein [Crinalium epipsammum]|nr:hypothetical protein [Crinalium epipsammum]